MNTTDPGSVYVLGDGDDLFAQKPTSDKYRNRKRYASHTTLAIGSNLYLPITCRIHHPHGRLYTLILGFFNDGSVGLVDNVNIPIQMINKPMGRTQCLYKDGRYILSSIKMSDEAIEYLTYKDIQDDPTWGQSLKDAAPTSFSMIYNPNAAKKWLIGEYDIKVTDNLNVRENF
jgi:hypothetical protein